MFSMRRISAGTALTLSMLLLGSNVAAAGTPRHTQHQQHQQFGRSAPSFYEFCRTRPGRGDTPDWKHKNHTPDWKHKNHTPDWKHKNDTPDWKHKNDTPDWKDKNDESDVVGGFSTTSSDGRHRSRTDHRDDRCRELLKKLKMRRQDLRKRHERTCGDAYTRRTCDHRGPSTSDPKWRDFDEYRSGRNAHKHFNRANKERKAGRTWVDRAHKHHRRANHEWAHYYRYKDRDPGKAEYHHSRAKKHEQRAERCWRHADDSYSHAADEQEEAEQLIKLLKFLLRLLKHHQMASS